MHPARVGSIGAALLLAAVATAADRPGWRGPSGMGQADAKNLPLTWGGKDGANVLWKVPLPGVAEKFAQDQNRSSAVIDGGRVFLTASYWRGDKADRKAQPEHHVACYQLADGKPLPTEPEIRAAQERRLDLAARS